MADVYLVVKCDENSAPYITEHALEEGAEVYEEYPRPGPSTLAFLWKHQFVLGARKK